MSKELKVTVNKMELPIKEYKGQRVVTLKEIDAVHERPEGTAGRNFYTNKKHLIEGVDYFQLTYEEARSTDFVERPNSQGLTLITESGYLMLVKSFTDDLAWTVQRQLVNVYFCATPEQRREAAANTAKSALAEAKAKNARARVASMWLKIAQVNPIPEYQQICAHYASAELTGGTAVLPLPEVRERTYTAEEVGRMLGVSGNKIGRLANEHHLKTPELGVEVWDKSRYSSKQVPAWRYNEKAVARLREILGNN
ncbi:ORF6N domain-containing protein [Pseudoflavonifractor sp. 524-17]|uniref:ORF6N domain-containing protein n=1 Tax=Pseudoflavonifractor sp. 524-17 TaxID=2304577 RepID=UPI00137B4DBE|nr:ORF6N domain-containing protein [Pseudoflavonifractor sp. 524-17]NCE63727.1 ORF6N domain-containing protein [Pseudoflavonifractor sp. 524-17]